MYFLNYFHTSTNVVRLIRDRLGTVPSGFTDIGIDYRRVVRSMRVIAPPESSYQVTFEDGALGSFIRSSGIFKKNFYNIESLSSDRRDYFTKLTAESMDLLKDLDYRLWFIVNLLITDVVFLKSERIGSASGSHLLGVVCISASDSWNASNLLESILLHEATHLNLFICDMVNSLFTVPVPRLAENDAKVVSALRIGQMRPLDKALHSAIVTVPLMYIQHLQSKTELVDRFSESLRVCVSGLLKKEKFYTPYGKSIVEQLAAFAENLDFKLLSAEIGNIDLALFHERSGSSAIATLP